MSLACLGAGPFAMAQTASHITPPSFQPLPNPEPVKPPAFPKTSDQSPEGSEKLSFFAKSFEVTGGFSSLELKTQKLLSGYQAKRLTVAEVFEIARRLEMAYSQAGYLLARVIVPPQELNDGSVVKLEVIGGFIEKIDLEGVPKSIRGRVWNLLEPLIGTSDVTSAAVERRLLLAGDNPGTEIRSTLKKGNLVGGSILVIEARQRPVNFLLSVDNTLPANLGRTNAGLGLDINSALSFGEQIYLRLIGDPKLDPNGYSAQHPRNRAIAAGLVLPLGADGMTFGTEITQSATTPKHDKKALGLFSLFDRVAFRLRYPFVRSYDFTLNGELALDLSREVLKTVYPITSDLSLDRLRVLRPALDGYWLNPWNGSFIGRAVFSDGIRGLGARSTDGAPGQIPLSRQGTHPNFQKLEANFSYSQPIVPHFSAVLYAHGQTSFNTPMANSEQIGIVGPQDISGFDLGTYQGDSGYSLRAELTSPWTLYGAGNVLSLAPYGFADQGEVHNYKPTAQERFTTLARSYGLGLHLIAGPQVFSNQGSRGLKLTLEWARQNLGDQGRDKDRITLYASTQF